MSNLHEVHIEPIFGSPDFFAACKTLRGECTFTSIGDFDHVSSETRSHYRKVGQ